MHNVTLLSRPTTGLGQSHACTTPSHIPKLIAPPHSTTPPDSPKPPGKPLQIPPKTPKTPCKSARERDTSPKKLPFLTRDSRTTAWDTKGRLEDMEYLYSELKEKMTDTTVERNGLEETLQIYKTRGESISKGER